MRRIQGKPREMYGEMKCRLLWNVMQEKLQNTESGSGYNEPSDNAQGSIDNYRSESFVF
jgi:hypothetical protein